MSKQAPIAWRVFVQNGDYWVEHASYRYLGDTLYPVYKLRADGKIVHVSVVYSGDKIKSQPAD